MLKPSLVIILLNIALIIVSFESRAQSFEDTIFNNQYKYATEEFILIDSDELGIQIAQATRSVFKDNDWKRSKLISQTPNRELRNLRSYLMGDRGETNYGDMKGSRENLENLRDWILNQADNSIDPVQIYKKSLILSEGSVFQAHLTIYELLRNESRFFDKSYINYKSTYKARAILFNKFIDIRGDLDERGLKFKGDHAGSWYRLYGMFLYIYNKSYRKKSNGYLLNPTRFVKIRGVATAHIAELIKPILMWPDPDKRKRFFNHAASDSAYSFIVNIADQKLWNSLLDHTPRSYLNRNDKCVGLFNK